jgi:hypothetical protein
MAARMPPSAKKDLLEWADTRDAASYLDRVLSGEIQINIRLNHDPRVIITDDHPFNEYFLLRQMSP